MNHTNQSQLKKTIGYNLPMNFCTEEAIKILSKYCDPIDFTNLDTPFS